VFNPSRLNQLVLFKRFPRSTHVEISFTGKRTRRLSLCLARFSGRQSAFGFTLKVITFPSHLSFNQVTALGMISILIDVSKSLGSSSSLVYLGILPGDDFNIDACLNR